MSSVLPIDSVRQSRLSARLQEISGTDPTVSALVGNLPDLCREASDRMKALPAFHPQFTLHDATHLLRVTELMGKVLGDSLATLNAVEIALLILAAHFHDLGMVPDAEELRALESSDEYRLHRDTWAVEHPNLREIERQIAQRNLADEERARLARLLAELESARLGDYLRLTHDQRSARLVGQLYGSDPRLKVAGASLTDPLARLCESHVLSAADLTPDRLPHDELIGISAVNLRYLALVLRLADILDFDRERTPDGLYRTLHFTSPVSLAEWEKHRGVQGWMIRPDLVRFEMRFDSPVYERTARQFLDWIDVELSAASEIVRSFPQEFARYALDLPLKVDRSRIGPRGEAYVYHDLEFSLSRDEIVKLLMTEQLYGDPSLCVRELLQNALDALRYRKALLASAGLAWEAGRVDMEHGVDEHGHEFLRCTDNGVGMDEGVITRFLTRGGRSYYRSPEFEQERIRFRAAGVDFDPCSQFGIGFMSCFMLGDRIRIETRRDYGHGRSHGTPWIVEINGLGGMLTLKRGAADQQVGTTVEISSRLKPTFLDSTEDKVHLIGVLKQYALAVECPVCGRCTVPEIAKTIDIQPGIRRAESLFEQLDIGSIICIAQDLHEIDPHIRGLIYESFLIDEHGSPALENKEACINFPEDSTFSRKRNLEIKSGKTFLLEYLDNLDAGPTCLDGIRVTGHSANHAYSIERGSSILYVSGLPFVLDVRGNQKPSIPPTREVRDLSWTKERKWLRLRNFRTLAEGRLWGKLISSFPTLPFETLWNLRAAHFGNFAAIPACSAWELLPIPIKDRSGDIDWRFIRELGGIDIAINPTCRYSLATLDGREIGPTEESTCSSTYYRNVFSWQLTVILLSMTAPVLNEGSLRFQLRRPTSGTKAPCEYLLDASRSAMHSAGPISVPFEGDLNHALQLIHAAPLVNRHHPLVKIAERSLYQTTWDELESFVHLALEGLADFQQAQIAYCKPERPPRWLKRLSHHYLAIDWSAYDPALRPPYRFWGEKEGWVEITDADFRRWAEAEVEDS